MASLKFESALVRLNKARAQTGWTSQKSLGQNFLINDSVIQKMLQEFEKTPDLKWCEVGPGLGALTDLLIESKNFKFVVEIDNLLVNYWEEQKLQVFESDALKFYFSKKFGAKKPWGLISNTPYQISASLVINMICEQNPPKKMILMMQKEVADKILAVTPSSEYGFLSVFVKTFYNTRSLVRVSPESFLPAPKVQSQVLLFDQIGEREIQAHKYLKFLKTCFMFPRKKMLNSFKSHPKAPKISSLLLELGYTANVRAHEVSQEHFKFVFSSSQILG